MEYLQTGSCDITSNVLPGLLCAAEHYEVEDLRRTCLDHAHECINDHTVRCMVQHILERILSSYNCQIIVLKRNFAKVHFSLFPWLVLIFSKSLKERERGRQRDRQRNRQTHTDQGKDRGIGRKREIFICENLGPNLCSCYIFEKLV